MHPGTPLLLIAGLLYTLSSVTEGPGEESMLVPVLSESQIWIEGSSNVNTFTCAADSFEGSARTRSTEAQDVPEPDRWSVELEVPVHTLDCGQRRMNRDMRDALKADDHPFIRFDYLRTLEVDPDMEWDQRIRLKLEGDLEIAGVTRTVELYAIGERNGDENVMIQGEREVRMSDFAIEPPTGLLGLVRANDELTVHFRIVARQESGSSSYLEGVR